MPSFSKTSKKKLDTCHQDLQIIFNYVIQHFDCTIVCGYRNKIAQNKAYEDGFSHVLYPCSNHNKIPSMAVDVVPWPIEWENIDRMKYFAGRVLGTADMLKRYGAITHSVRWGGDWDMDNFLKDTNFHDFPHFELV